LIDFFVLPYLRYTIYSENILNEIKNIKINLVIISIIMTQYNLSSSLLLSLFLGTLVFTGVTIVPTSLVDAHPLIVNPRESLLNKSTDVPNNHYMQYNYHTFNDSNVISNTIVNGDIECKMCSYVASKLNTTLFHNPKVIDFVTSDIEKICKVLPESVQIECNNAAINIAPVILQQIGIFIADEGCQELDICPGH